ncbi:hypothetical protein RPALISO_76 [Ruegeria phage RpAliso]|nr:hypothetical protein RPALISO_76 [Ruegeria phage RpAliso]
MIQIVSILTWLKGLKPRHILYGMGVLTVCFLVWEGSQFVSDKFAAERAVLELTTAVKAKEATIQQLRDAAEQHATAEKAADAAADRIEQAQEGYREILREVDRASDEEDAEVAPVLRDVLRSLDGL